MKYKRIILLGAGGSGKSHLSKQIQNITGYPLTHLDNEFWKPDWVKTPKDQWIQKQEELMAGDSWIIDGNYNSTLEIRIKKADLILILDTNRFVRLYRILRRHGKKRTDLPDYLDEPFDKEFIDFLKWSWTFEKKGRVRLMNIINDYPDKQVLHLENKRDIQRFLQRLQG